MTASGAVRQSTTLQQFTVLVDHMPTDEQVDALAVQFDDLDIGRSLRKPVGHIYVDRRATSLADAIASAVRDVESIGLRPMWVEADTMVTIDEIAERVAESPETVRQWSTGERGKGGFPASLNPGRGSPYYRWPDVAAWLRERMGLTVPDTDSVFTVANHILQARAHAPSAGQIAPLLQLLTE